MDVASKNTKKYKETQENTTKTCITTKDLHAGERMADAFNRNEVALSYLADAECEVPMVDLVGGISIQREGRYPERE